MPEFYFLTHDGVDPQFNIASEEYLLKQKDGFYVYLWKNSPSVIVGVNQNALEEVNWDYVNQNDVKVVRRITGGGAVYHDLNNVCYTVIAPFNDKQDNYKVFTAPVIEYLNKIGVKAEFSGRNDITVDGKKISGNAQTVFGNRIMHHGTLLFKTDMQALANSLKPSKIKIESKGIKSVRARVTNIFEQLPQKMTAMQFFDGLKRHLSKGLKKYDFCDHDLQKIQDLVDKKYSTFDWNVGNSPKSNATLSGKFDFGYISINLDVQEGLIKNANVQGDFFELKPIGEWAQKLLGLQLQADKLAQVFLEICAYVKGADGNQLLKTFFDKE